MRVYAADCADTDETETNRLTAIRRGLSWYLHTADNADHILNPQHQKLPLPPPEPASGPWTLTTYEEALEWFEAECVNLMAAVRQADEIGEYATAWRLPCTLWGFFNLRKYWNNWVVSHEIGLKAARQSRDKHGEASILISLGAAHWDCRRFEDALPHLQRALSLQREIGNRWGEGMALTTLGLVYRDLHNPERAIEYHREALDIFRELGYLWGEALTSAGLGRAFLDLRQPQRALEHHHTAVALFREIGNRWGEGIALTDLCITYAALGDHEETLRWSHRSLSRSREIGDRNTEARTLHLLGQALHATGHPDAALEAWRQALSIFDDLADQQAAQVRASIANLTNGASPDDH
jgi:tetratricopeptide (TPR) repeat protein